MSEPVIDVTFWPREIDEILSRTENPHHRAMLKNIRKHILLEMVGRADLVVTPELMVDEPFYRVAMQNGTLELNGMEELRQFYDAFIAAGSVWSPDHEVMVVHDGGIWAESHLLGITRGDILVAGGRDADPDGWYVDSFYAAYTFNYDKDARLIGEFLYDSGKHEHREIRPEQVITWEDCAKILAPWVDNEPA